MRSTSSFATRLAARFQELRKSDAKAVVLTGQGKIFSAGVDLKRLSCRRTPTIFVDSCRPSTASMRRCSSIRKPVVAAINGHAIAGGCVLACCADRRIMAREAGRIGVTEILVGVPFPALAFEIVRFAVPPRYLPEFTLSGATYATDEALRRGWVDELAEPVRPHGRCNGGRAGTVVAFAGGALRRQKCKFVSRWSNACKKR